MTHEAEALLDAMNAYSDALPLDQELDFEGEFADRVEQVGREEVVRALLRRHQDSALTNWMMHLGFVWVPLPYAAWLALFRDVSHDEHIAYQFMCFADYLLGFDLARIVDTDSKIGDSARRLCETRSFGERHAIADSAREVLADSDIDADALWDALAAGGAPMRLRPPVRAHRT